MNFIAPQYCQVLPNKGDFLYNVTQNTKNIRARGANFDGFP